ncbi:MAG TPA: prepilin-type N-terminal cleavage/methylation domain-containing protein, partial [Casimicrobiaceae bacterium]
MGSLGRGRSSHGTPGFTLVEILVVIIVLGIVAGLAIALVNPDERDVSAREARRFAGALEYAAQRAQWRDEMLG